MTRLKFITTLSIVLLTLTYFIHPAVGQEPSSYKMTLEKVIDYKKKNKISVILKVSPTIEDFKLIASTKVEYSFGRKKLKTNIQKDPNTHIIVYGDNFLTKNTKLFKPIKNDLEVGKDEFLLVFTFSNIKGKHLAEGSIRYGLWESNNPDIRNEQTFVFGKDKIIKY